MITSQTKENLLLRLKHFQIFILGALSGMPLFVIYTTLPAWLKTSGVELSIIASLAIARSFYSLKFTWAPFVDQFKIPVLCRLGQRKSWMLISLGIIASIFAVYSMILTPTDSIAHLYFLTTTLGFASATLDIAIDAFRIESTEKSQLAISVANTIFGYRMGGLVAGAGAMYFAEDYGWSAIFAFFSGLYVAGMLFVLRLKEPAREIAENQGFTSLSGWKMAVIDPFIDFFSRQYSLLILTALVFYKLGDAMLGVVATPFYLDMGFSLKEIATIIKLYGFIAMISGTYLGGIVVYKLGHIRGMLFCGLVQGVTHLSYIWLSRQGHDTSALMIAITIENLGEGMGSAALVGYVSYLCNKNFSATQYAFLTSATGLFSHSIVVFGGKIAQMVGWDYYFFFTVILAIPGLMLLLLLDKKINRKN